MSKMIAGLICLLSVLQGADANAKHSNRQLTGRDIAQACSDVSEPTFCNGFVEAIHLQTGDRYLDRRCPPAIVQRNGARYSYNAEAVRQYLQQHPSAVERDARELVFDAITQRLSHDLDADCSPQK